MKAVYIFLLVLVFGGYNLQSQSPDKAMPIALSYSKLELPADLSSAQSSRITTKVIRITDRYGFIAAGNFSNFAIYPRFDIIDEYQMSGLQKLTAVKAEFTLHVKQLDNGVVLGTVSEVVSGTGTSRGRAITSAINAISTSGNRYEDFILGVKQKLQHYYAENCSVILSRADNHFRVKQYTQAISEVLKIPAEATNCQEDSKTKLSEYYLQFQEQYCAELLQGAKSRIAVGDYNSAMEMISLIDPKSSCAKEVPDLLAKVEGHVTDWRERRFQLLQQVYSNQVELSKYRIDAYQEIAKAYYAARSEPKHWMNVVLVR